MANDDNTTKCGVTFEHEWHGYRDTDNNKAVCDGTLWSNKKDKK